MAPATLLSSWRIVAAGMPGMAATQPHQTLCNPPDRPIFSDRFDHIPAARRFKPASRADQWADRPLVGANEGDERGRDRPLRHFPDPPDHGEDFSTWIDRRRATARARVGSDRQAWSNVREGPRGTTIKSTPSGSSA